LRITASGCTTTVHRTGETLAHFMGNRDVASLKDLHRPARPLASPWASPLASACWTFCGVAAAA